MCDKIIGKNNLMLKTTLNNFKDFLLGVGDTD